MRCVLQVVKKAQLSIDNKLYSSIDKGFLILVGFSLLDTEEDIKKVMDKILGLRLFKDENGKTNLSLTDVNGEIMIVSQFTLYASLKKGKRPSFTDSANYEVAKPLYDKTLEYVRKTIKCEQGVFGADMQIELINDGPFTLIIDSKEL